MARLLLATLALTVSLTTASIGAQALNTSTEYDTSLKHVADVLVPRLDRVTAYHPRIQPFFDSNLDPYLARLKRVLKRYQAAHPGESIQVAVSLIAGYFDLRTKTNEKWDFLGLPQFFRGPIYETIANHIYGKTTTYRVYSTPFALPKPFQRDKFKSSLAIYVAISNT